ncbi:MAG: DUF5050 domain-containing protein [Clostridiales bacterium]|jgi:hypothetical protein|nr:DUF5050 domain-containing protein [Clostridiales bacterium]
MGVYEPITFDNAGDALRHIANTGFNFGGAPVSGRDILLSDRIVGIFADIAANLRDDKQLIKLLQDQGALSVLRDAARATASEKGLAIKRAVSILPFAKTEGEALLYMFADALGWDLNQPEPVPEAEEYGNTVANILNSGFTAMKDGWIYCGYGDRGLHKTQPEAAADIRLNDDDCEYINVLGDWVYYRNNSDGGKIYKTRTSGYGRVKLNDDDSRPIWVTGGQVYYGSENDGGKFCSVDINGGRKIILGDKFRFVDIDFDIKWQRKYPGSGIIPEPGLVNFAGGWIYYCDMNPVSKRGEQIRYNKVRPDGNDMTTIYEIYPSKNYYADDLYFDEEYIYYTIHTAEGEDDLYRLNINAARKGNPYHKIRRLKYTGYHLFNFTGGWIYRKHGGGISRFRNDGSDFTEVCAF